MKFNLNKGEDNIQQYITVMAEVLKADVEIIDDQMKKIRGTNNSNEGLENGKETIRYVYRQTIEKGEFQIMENTCHKSPTFVMGTPIVYNDVTVGVIGITCFTEKQRVHIINNFETFKNFQSMISELIVSSILDTIAYEKSRAITKFFHNVFETIEDGLFIVGHKNLIINHNKKSKVILDLEDQSLIGMPIDIMETGKTFFGRTEYNIKIGNNYRLVTGTYLPLSISLNQNVLVFRDSKTIQSYINKSSTNESVSPLDKIIGQSKNILILKNKIGLIHDSNSTVLITGESGTGKEQIAKSIHLLSHRKTKPFLSINCSALPEHLIDQALFGYIKQTFSGEPEMDRIGLLEKSCGGTIFIDEISELPIHIQVKLLHVLEKMTIPSLNSKGETTLDLRVIAATDIDLAGVVEKKLFREDLYFKLNVIPFHTTPLRKRPSDLRIMVLHFIRLYEKILNKTITQIDNDYWHAIEQHQWLGNIRELQNVVEYSLNMVASNTRLQTYHLPQDFVGGIGLASNDEYNLVVIEKSIIKKLLEENQGTLTREDMAKKLGIGVATLYRKIEKYNL